MSEKTYLIRFNDVAESEAGLYADELREALLDTSKGVKVEKMQAHEGSQDFGSVLVVVLAAPSVVAVASAVADWLKLRNSATIDITSPDGHIVATNLTSKDAASLIQQKLNTSL